MNLGVIGAGATGLTAAYDAVKRGHAVTVLEAADELGAGSPRRSRSGECRWSATTTTSSAATGR
ncbi:FAD-dependent oxidoreductase [Streptomyces sp. MBT49]|uniref:FAD-dependent oxidoreductase n=1 Tax=Streptomyces sp. MBT49 TaxID=1488380 RepID=UPI001F35358D|nr:FAD-dependent oxidoreductase [Streptomyces sp. MBT49]